MSKNGLPALEVVGRIERCIERLPWTGCWIFNGATSNGYGIVKNADGYPSGAHRLMYEAAKGQIPDGLVLDHLCRVPCCVNPDHLEAVTQEENIRRGLCGVLRGTGAFRNHPTRMIGHDAPKIGADGARDIVRRLASGTKGRDLATEYGVAESAISDIKRGRRWASATADLRGRFDAASPITCVPSGRL
jgi:hypothetical protein